MQEKNRILRELEQAIDRGDIDAVTAGVDRLTEQQSPPIQAEDAMLFAAGIRKINKESQAMNTKKQPKKFLTVAIVAALVLVMGATAFAATQRGWFSFVHGDRFITGRTNAGMSEQEAEEIIKNSELPADFDPSQIAQAEVEELTFATVEEARTQLAMAIPLPDAMPALTLADATGNRTIIGEAVERKTVWLNYSDEQGRILGITVSCETIADAEPVFSYTTHDMDDGSVGAYTTPAGDTYTTLTESDDTGEKTAHIATIMLGEYEYSLVFFGFEEAERAAIIDSTDLGTIK